MDDEKTIKEYSIGEKNFIVVMSTVAKPEKKEPKPEPIKKVFLLLFILFASPNQHRLLRLLLRKRPLLPQFLLILLSLMLLQPELVISYPVNHWHLLFKIWWKWALSVLRFASVRLFICSDLNFQMILPRININRLSKLWEWALIIPIVLLSICFRVTLLRKNLLSQLLALPSNSHLKLNKPPDLILNHSGVSAVMSSSTCSPLSPNSNNYVLFVATLLLLLNSCNNSLFLTLNSST